MTRRQRLLVLILSGLVAVVAPAALCCAKSGVTRKHPSRLDHLLTGKPDPDALARTLTDLQFRLSLTAWRYVPSGWRVRPPFRWVIMRWLELHEPR